MDQFDEYLRKRAQEEPAPIPEDYHGRIFAVCAGLEEEPEQKQEQSAPKRGGRTLRWTGWIAAALAVLITLPNVSPSAAAAMAEIPVLGAIVEIITFRDYAYDDGHSSAEVRVPELGGSEAAEQVNREVEDYEEQLLAQFEADRAELGEGYQNLSVSSQVVTDSPNWFTLRIDVVEIRASGYNYSRFYHIDKRTGETVNLGDLFGNSETCGTVLAAEVLRQMEADREDGYFPENVETIDPDQNFYWGDQGELVLVFDEYAVAAGYMGMPEFAISPDVYRPLLP